MKYLPTSLGSKMVSHFRSQLITRLNAPSAGNHLPLSHSRVIRNLSFILCSPPQEWGSRVRSMKIKQKEKPPTTSTTAAFGAHMAMSMGTTTGAKDEGTACK